MAETKRLNFDITPDQEEEISSLRAALGSSSAKDAVLRAVQVLGVLARETRDGKRLFLKAPDGELSRLLLPEIEPPGSEWQWLSRRAHPWRRQMWIKGRRLLASTIWREVVTGRMSEEGAAEEWELPLEAVREAVCWSSDHQALIAAEAREEKRWLEEQGMAVEPSHPR